MSTDINADRALIEQTLGNADRAIEAIEHITGRKVRLFDYTPQGIEYDYERAYYDRCSGEIDTYECSDSITWDELLDYITNHPNKESLP